MLRSRERSAREQEREREEEAERLEREHRRLEEAVWHVLPLVCERDVSENTRRRPCHMPRAPRPYRACIPAADADGRHAGKSWHLACTHTHDRGRCPRLGKCGSSAGPGKQVASCGSGTRIGFCSRQARTHSSTCAHTRGLRFQACLHDCPKMPAIPDPRFSHGRARFCATTQHVRPFSTRWRGDAAMTGARYLAEVHSRRLGALCQNSAQLFLALGLGTPREHQVCSSCVVPCIRISHSRAHVCARARAQESLPLPAQLADLHHRRANKLISRMPISQNQASKVANKQGVGSSVQPMPQGGNFTLRAQQSSNGTPGCPNSSEPQTLMPMFQVEFWRGNSAPRVRTMCMFPLRMDWSLGPSSSNARRTHTVPLCLRR